MGKWLRKLLFFTTLCSVVMWTGCEDVLVDDLEGKQLLLVAPGDSVTVVQSNIQFVWETLEDAVTYNLQVVSPTFSGIQSYVLDSVVTGNKLAVLLQPGKYSWRVIASNQASEAISEVRYLEVDTAKSVSDGTVILELPLSNAFKNILANRFQWEVFQTADDYRFEVRRNSETGSMLFAGIVDTNVYDYTFTEQGIFYWGVQAQKQFENPSSFSYRKLTIDTARPAVPALQQPTDQQVISDFPIAFTWSRNTANVISPEFDSLFVFSVNPPDTTFEVAVKLDGVQTYTLDTIANGNYQWYARAYDLAENKGGKSAVRSFTVLHQ